MASTSVRTDKKTGRKYVQLSWNEGGKQHRVSIGPADKVTPLQRRQAETSKQHELDTGQPVFTGSPLFDTFRTEYLEWHAGEYPAGHFRVAQILEQHCGDFEGKALSLITAKDVEKWRAKRRRVVRSSTALKEYSALYALLSKAVLWGGLLKHPCQGMARPQVISDKPPPMYQLEELQQLYTAGQGRGARWRFMANTGLRPSEMLNLECRQVNLKRRELTVLSREDEDEPGVTDRKYWVRTSRTKTGKYRVIPLSDAALAAFHECMRGREQQRYLCPQYTSPAFGRSFKNDAQRRGLPGSIYWLRHSYASYLVMGGVPLKTVQALMGHANIQTTMRYLHLLPDHTRDAARSIAI